jgi:hypothetical protein
MSKPLQIDNDLFLSGYTGLICYEFSEQSTAPIIMMTGSELVDGALTVKRENASYTGVLISP